MIRLTSFSKPILTILRFGRRLWVRVALMALMAVIAAGVAPLFARFLPDEIVKQFGPEAVLPILTILASGMLAVSTFSLNVMVSAYRAAAAQATPRAHRILLSDITTQTVLATFIGAFVYSLSAIILFQSHLIAPGTSVIMLGMTVVVVVLVILAMLRWIDHLSNLGSMDNTLQTIETRARPSLMRTRQEPALGATPLGPGATAPAGAVPLRAGETGYVQFIDMSALDQALAGKGATLHLEVVPGSFLLRGQSIAMATGLPEEEVEELHEHFVLGEIRTFEQDAAYGLLVLAEVASRALSPGINDPGTAIDVIARQERMIWEWAIREVSQEPPKYPRVFMRTLTSSSLVTSAFQSIARDGARMIEVVSRLQRALGALAEAPDEDLARAAREMGRHVRQYAHASLELESEKARVKTEV